MTDSHRPAEGKEPFPSLHICGENGEPCSGVLSHATMEELESVHVSVIRAAFVRGRHVGYRDTRDKYERILEVMDERMVAWRARAKTALQELAARPTGCAADICDCKHRRDAPCHDMSRPDTHAFVGPKPASAVATDERCAYGYPGDVCGALRSRHREHGHSFVASKPTSVPHRITRDQFEAIVKAGTMPLTMIDVYSALYAALAVAGIEVEDAASPDERPE